MSSRLCDTKVTKVIWFKLFCQPWFFVGLVLFAATFSRILHFRHGASENRFW